MPEFTVHVGSRNFDAEVVALYESVGWTNYTEDRQVLVQAIRRSAFVVTCRSDAGELVGLARAISDDATICRTSWLPLRFRVAAPVGRCLKPSSPDTGMSGSIIIRA